ncbi:MBL fold metallo-hydrolase [Roseateles sp. SL47]|uniref:MBL fold metallo-hydrolase n=1 Tax=Roseateles sp. SL47 TaxID=2995138 RepID=UPI002270F11B|nr:MBL fold metallo-hydrolase [Roseateles sp. SL47]WAC73496.1 MBL fold metallo-hydrolase [Roseateles sp. SL47]
MRRTFSFRPVLAACLSGLLFCSAVQATADVSKVPPPGIYRFKLGQLDVTALSDGTHPFPVDTVMVGTTDTEIGKALDHEFLGRPPAGSINAFLIHTGQQLVLVDAGAGALYGDCCGQVLQQIRAAGYSPEQVDVVLLTHLHKDHVGGITASGRALFPNAVIRASKADLDYWSSTTAKARAPDFLASFFDAAVEALAPYKAAGRLRPIEGAGPIGDDIAAITSPGHTPGHLSYSFTSGGQTLVVMGDLIHVAALQLPHPEVTVKYDSDGTAARQSRVTELRAAARGRWLLAAAHVSFPGLGHVRETSGGFEWVPVNFEAAPTR